MTDVTIHTVVSAPEDSRPHFEGSQKTFSRVPGPHGVMAKAPALLDGSKHLHTLFRTAISFDKDERTVV